MNSQTQQLKLARIEAGSASELDDVMAVMNGAFDPAYGEAWTRAQCAGILPMNGVMLKIARGQDGEAIGFTLFRTVVHEAELLLLAVDPDHRRAGVGRQLLQDFCTCAAQEGAEQVHLEVRENNPAKQLYTASGFAPVGRRHKYYRGSDGARYDALTLARSVKP